MELYYDLTGEYTRKLDDYYRLLETRYRALLQQFRAVNKVTSILLPISIVLLATGIGSAFFTPYPAEVLTMCGVLSIILAIITRRLNAQYTQKLEHIVDKFSGLYDIYLEIFRVNEIVDAQKRGEKIDELLRNKPFLKEIPCDQVSSM